MMSKANWNFMSFSRLMAKRELSMYVGERGKVNDMLLEAPRGLVWQLIIESRITLTSTTSTSLSTLYSA